MNEGKKIFSIRGSLIEGWELTKLNIGFLIVYQMILYFLIGIFNYSGFYFFSFISVIVMILGKMGLFKSALLLTQGKKLSFNQLYIHWPLLPSWVIASLLFGILVISSIILPYLVIFLMMWLKMDAHYPFVFILISTFLIFLTIIFSLFLWTIYGFFPFFIVDKKIGPLKSLRKSEKITKGIRWHVLLFFLTCIGINLLGLLCFGIGFLITTPVTLIAMAAVYEKMTNQSNISIQPDDIRPLAS